MGVLTEIPSYRICTDKGRFDINPAFDIVLEVQRLYKEESLTDYEKIRAGVEYVGSKQVESQVIETGRTVEDHAGYHKQIY